MLLIEKNFRVLFGTAYFLLIAVVVGLLSTSAYAQTEATVQSETVRTNVQEAVKTNSIQPTVIDLIGVKIGMTRDEVKDKLGKPKIDDPDGFYYEMSDNKIAQIRLDADKKVSVVVVTYRDGKDAPKFEDVFGGGTQVAAQPDGSLYNLVRYPEAGFWVAYSRTAGDKPTVTVSMQKL